MPKIDLSQVPLQTGTIYPEEYARPVAGRSSYRLGPIAGLTRFGANITMLEPGAASSLRHWHVHEDEFLVVLSGTLTLVDDNGDTPLAPGDCAAFPAGEENGHHIVNRSDAPGSFLVIGSRAPKETAYYSDIDLMVEIEADGFTFKRKDGSPYIPTEESS